MKLIKTKKEKRKKYAEQSNYSNDENVLMEKILKTILNLDYSKDT